MNLVFFEATDDTATSRIHTARRKALASAVGSPRYDLYGNDAIYTKVKTTHTSASRFDLFSGMGHGNADEFTGQYGWNLYDTKDSKGVNYTTARTIVHLFSCDCGQTLGPFLVRNGAKAFVGYIRPVAVPSNQAIADEFVKVAATIDRSILNGDSAGTTKSKADAEFSATEARLLAPGSVATPRDVARFRLNHSAMVGPWSGSQYGSY